MAKPAPTSTRLRLKLNLLYPQGLSEKLPLKFIKWLISYGRFIVIFVEVIVVAAFIFRFSLDSTLDDLKRKINNEIPYIEALQGDETLIKQTQLKLATIGKSYSETSQFLEIFPQISKSVPQKVKFVSLSLEKSADAKIVFKVTGKSQSNVDLASFISNLKKDPQLKDINLDSVGFEQNEISFTISGGTK